MFKPLVEQIEINSIKRQPVSQTEREAAEYNVVFNKLPVQLESINENLFDNILFEHDNENIVYYITNEFQEFINEDLNFLLNEEILNEKKIIDTVIWKAAKFSIRFLSDKSLNEVLARYYSKNGKETKESKEILTWSRERKISKIRELSEKINFEDREKIIRKIYGTVGDRRINDLERKAERTSSSLRYLTLSLFYGSSLLLLPLNVSGQLIAMWITIAGMLFSFIIDVIRESNYWEEDKNKKYTAKFLTTSEIINQIKNKVVHENINNELQDLDYSNGKWKRIMLIIGLTGLVGFMPAVLSIFAILAGKSLSSIVLSKILGVSTEYQKKAMNKEMQKIFEIAKNDPQVKKIANLIKKELDSGNANKEVIKELNFQFKERLKEIKKSKKILKEEDLKKFTKEIE
jgi:hypothetical protein